MIDELKELVNVLASLPHLTVWILVGFLVYKIVVIGSTTALLRLLILKTHEWATKPKTVNFELGDVCIGHDVERGIKAELLRLTRNDRLWVNDLSDLRDAVDIVIEKRHNTGA